MNRNLTKVKEYARHLRKEPIRQWEWQMQKQQDRSMHTVFEKELVG